MTVPVIGAEEPVQPPEPIVWAIPPAPPKPIDLDSLDLDKLAELLDRSPPKTWGWALYGFYLLLMQVVSLLLASTWQHQTSAAAVAGFALYSVVGVLYLLFVARECKATANTRPRLRRNQALAMCGAALSLIAALPWSVFLWGRGDLGNNTTYAFWPIIVILPLAFPPQPLSAKTLLSLRDGVLPSLPKDLANLISHLRFQRGDWHFPIRLAATAQLVVVFVIACALFAPYALGWARPMPHSEALRTAAFLLVLLAGFAALRLVSRFAGSPRRWWDIALGSLWLAVALFLLGSNIFVIGKLSPQPNQLSLVSAASWLILVQAVFLIAQRQVPPLQAQTAQ